MANRQLFKKGFNSKTIKKYDWNLVYPFYNG